MTSAVFREALRPARPGVMVRVLAPLFPGVGRTARQIVDYAEGWSHDATTAVADDGPLLVAFGDSLAQGVGAGSRADAFVALVAEAAALVVGRPVGVVNLSRSGARIADVLQLQVPAYRSVADDRFEQRIVGGICTVGSNDLARSARFATTRSRASELIEALPRSVSVATVPDLGSVMAKRLNRHLRTVAAVSGRPVADVAERLTSWRGLMAGDRFHPNDAGHRLWADVVACSILGPSTVIEPAQNSPR